VPECEFCGKHNFCSVPKKNWRGANGLRYSQAQMSPPDLVLCINCLIDRNGNSVKEYSQKLLEKNHERNRGKR